MCQALMMVVAVGWSMGAEPATPRIAQIFVCGNAVTPQSVILRQLPLYPGQVLSGVGVRAAEQRLKLLSVWGIGATVTVLEPDGASAYRDILVNVRETRFTHLVFGLPDAALSWVRRLSVHEGTKP
jgi:outer membrane protein assembly factor BamA